jgi:hypothetical protein
VPNPEMRHPHPGQSAEPRPLAENGILSSIGGEYIAAGDNQLPKACKGLESPRTVVLEAPDQGLVKITYELDWYKHRRSTFWHWKAVRADKVQG